MPMRTHTCGELRSSDIKSESTLCGWVNAFRDQGKGLVFIDIRDRTGLTQAVFDQEDCDTDVMELARSLRREDVVQITGRVDPRAGGTNPKLDTGEIEVRGTALTVFSRSNNPPILPDDNEAAKMAEEVRLRHRYIDLRRPTMQRTLQMRHDLMALTREYFHNLGFLEIETPLLIKSTPEGARDFVVPSRIYPGKWYALPQSPQIFKQILMIAGCDRYIQICKCLRDEDPRADRQAEFTQIDLELSFVDRDEVIKIMTGFIRRVFKQLLDLDLGQIPKVPWQLAIDKWGVDRPDMRFELHLQDISEVAAKTDFKVFQSALAKDRGVVKAIRIPNSAEALTRMRSGTNSSTERECRATTSSATLNVAVQRPVVAKSAKGRSWLTSPAALVSRRWRPSVLPFGSVMDSSTGTASDGATWSRPRSRPARWAVSPGR